MTKLRDPLSTEYALDRAFGVLDRAVVGLELGRSPRTLRDYGDPDHPSGISMDDALAIDLAYRRAGGTGFPLFESYYLRLEAEAAAPGYCATARDRLAGTAVTEAGEAIAAIFGATRLGATSADRAHAMRETVQAMTAFIHTLPMLDDAVSPTGLVLTGGYPTA